MTNQPTLVWAVTVSNYVPPEVIAIYDNEDAARQHVDADRSDLGLTVTVWQVASEYEGALMRLGKRTAKLVREAAVAGFVQGTRWAGWSPPRGEPDPFPMDPEIWVLARRCAEKFPDLYPALSKVEDEEYDAARAAQMAEYTAQFASMLGRSAAPGGPTC